MAYQIHNLSWLAQPLVFPLRCQKPFSPSLGEQEISMCPSDELTSLILSPLSVSSVIFIFPLSLSHCTLMYINHSDPCKQRHIERTARFPVLVHIIYHIDIQCIPPLHLSLSLSIFHLFSRAHSFSLYFSILFSPSSSWTPMIGSWLCSSGMLEVECHARRMQLVRTAICLGMASQFIDAQQDGLKSDPKSFVFFSHTDPNGLYPVRFHAHTSALMLTQY